VCVSALAAQSLCASLQHVEMWAKSPNANYEASNYHLTTAKSHYTTEKMLAMKVVVSAFG